VTGATPATTAPGARRVLVVRTDNDGDVLLTGPGVRAVARHAEHVGYLCAPSGERAARLLPGVDDVLVWPCPWSGYAPPPVDAPGTLELVERIRAGCYDAAVVLTSWHQSPLPMALLLRLAGVPYVAAASEDYPGALLDLRFRADRSAPGQVHEVEAMLALVAAAGFPPAPGDDARLAVRRPLPAGEQLPPGLPAPGSYVVVHPGASVPARAPSPQVVAGYVAELAARGRRVVVTGAPQEAELTRRVAAGRALDLGGRTDLPVLAAVLEGAACLVVGNTGPAHLAAAVGTPVVSLFAPVVPVQRWSPWGVATRVLGDQDAACRGTGARQCPVAGHPCLDRLSAAEVADAVDDLTGAVAPAAAGAADRCIDLTAREETVVTP
jgi:ADP-heptose:LPS heptosyltransferase